jgi:hypothetical protein
MPDGIEYQEEYNEWFCGRCSKWMSSLNGANCHIRTSKQHNYCEKCDRDFPTVSSLNQHLANSTRHRPEVAYNCPVCNKQFCLMSQVAAHVESVHSSRREIEQFVRKNDPSNIITSRTIGWRDDNDHDFSRFSMEQLARHCYFNDQNYFECPYDDCNRALNSKSNLWNHVNSNRHINRAYHCPGCRKGYISVAGLFMHFERGCPNKEMAAKGVGSIMNVIGGMRLAYY